MQRIQDRNPQALDELFRRYRDLLRSVVLRIVHDNAATDDVLQECMLEVWNHAGSYVSEKGEPLSWIVTMTKRRAIDHLRRVMAYSQACDRLETATRMVPVVQDAATDCEQADMGRVLREHLSQLPEAQQQVIHLAFLEGMSQREVARATQIPLGTVKTRLELGLKKLRIAFRVQYSVPQLKSA